MDFRRTPAILAEGHAGLQSRPVGSGMRLTGVFIFLYVLALVLFGQNSATAVIADWAQIALICVFLVEQIGRRRNLSFPVPLICYSVFLCYLMFQMIWSPGTFSMLRNLVAILVLSLAVVNYEVEAGGKTAVEFAFYAGVACTFIYSLSSGEIPPHGVRIGSTMVNPNGYAELLVFALLFGMRRWLMDGAGHRLTRRRVAALLALLVLGLYGIVFLTGSRKGMIFILVACLLVLTYWVWHQPIRRRLLITVLVIVLLGGVGYALYQSPQVERFGDISAFLKGGSVEDTGLIKRGAMLDDAIDLWQQRPFVGWGLEQFRYVSGWDTYSHDNYVELLANEGLIGTLAFLMVYVTTLASLLRSLRLSKDSLLSAEAFWAVVVMFVMLGWDLAAVTYYDTLSWVMLSAAIAVSARVRHQVRPSPTVFSRVGARQTSTPSSAISA